MFRTAGLRIQSTSKFPVTRYVVSSFISLVERNRGSKKVRLCGNFRGIWNLMIVRSLYLVVKRLIIGEEK